LLRQLLKTDGRFIRCSASLGGKPRASPEEGLSRALHAWRSASPGATSALLRSVYSPISFTGGQVCRALLLGGPRSSLGWRLQTLAYSEGHPGRQVPKGHHCQPALASSRSRLAGLSRARGGPQKTTVRRYGSPHRTFVACKGAQTVYSTPLRFSALA